MKMSKFSSISGWVGSALFSITLIPSVLQAWDKHTVNHLGWIFLITWLAGILFLFIYIAANNFKTKNYQLPLWIPCILNIVFTIYLCYIKLMY